MTDALTLDDRGKTYLKLKSVSVSENLVFTPESGFVSFTLSDLTPWSGDPGCNEVGTHQADIFSPHTLPGGIQLPSVFILQSEI